MPSLAERVTIWSAHKKRLALLLSAVVILFVLGAFCNSILGVAQSFLASVIFMTFETELLFKQTREKQRIRNELEGILKLVPNAVEPTLQTAIGRTPISDELFDHLNQQGLAHGRIQRLIGLIEGLDYGYAPTGAKEVPR